MSPKVVGYALYALGLIVFHAATFSVLGWSNTLVFASIVATIYGVNTIFSGKDSTR